MSINEINAEAKESLRKYFKDSNDVKHGNEGREELTKEEIIRDIVAFETFIFLANAVTVIFLFSFINNKHFIFSSFIIFS